MGHRWLDKLVFEEETLNRWDAKRRGDQSSEYLPPAERRGKETLRENKKKYGGYETKQEYLESELKKYEEGHLFKLDEVPDIFKEKIFYYLKIVDKEQVLNKENLTLCGDFEFFLRRYGDTSGWIPASWRSMRGMISGGLEYVENEEGIPRLRVYKARKSGY